MLRRGVLSVGADEGEGGGSCDGFVFSCGQRTMRKCCEREPWSVCGGGCGDAIVMLMDERLDFGGRFANLRLVCQTTTRAEDAPQLGFLGHD